MEGDQANLCLVLCFILATGISTVNAFPMAPYYQTAFFQQSSAINTITEAIMVSYNNNCAHNLLICAFCNRMQLQRQLEMLNKT